MTYFDQIRCMLNYFLVMANVGFGSKIIFARHSEPELWHNEDVYGGHFEIKDGRPLPKFQNCQHGFLCSLVPK